MKNTLIPNKWDLICVILYYIMVSSRAKTDFSMQINNLKLLTWARCEIVIVQSESSSTNKFCRLLRLPNFSSVTKLEHVIFFILTLISKVTFYFLFWLLQLFNNFALLLCMPWNILMVKNQFYIFFCLNWNA